MQIQNPWVDKLYFGGPTSSQYIELYSGDISINSELKISTANNRYSSESRKLRIPTAKFSGSQGFLKIPICWDSQ